MTGDIRKRIDYALNELHASESIIAELRQELVAARAISAKYQALDRYSDVSQILTHRGTLLLLLRIQEAIWTVKRVLRAGRRLESTQKHTLSRPRGPESSGDAKTIIDITSTYRGLAEGGIRRVANSIAAACSGSDEVLVAVSLEDGRLVRLRGGFELGEEVGFTFGSRYVILDTFWTPMEDHLRNLARAKAAGCMTVLCVHDVLFLDIPGTLPKEWVDEFKEALGILVPYIDGFLTVSRSSAKQLESALDIYWGRRAPVAHFYPGREERQQFHTPKAHRLPIFTSVGTIEPRKGYNYALDAFEMLWANGFEVGYQIIGSEGWLTESLLRRITLHPEYGRRLFWHRYCDDARMHMLLADSYCYLQTSIAEGFGLPLIEASAMGLPLLVSDIPVFREICIKNTTFFSVCDPVSLRDQIISCLAAPPSPSVTIGRNWATSLEEMIAAIDSLEKRRS